MPPPRIAIFGRPATSGQYGRRVARRRLTDLSALDESLLVWQRLGVPWNGQIALAARAIDAARARAAIDAALAHHPLARCAIVDDRRGRPYWAYDDTAGVGAVDVVACADDDAVERLRIAQIEAPLPIGDAPLVRAVVARGAAEDLLIVTVSHVMTDGLGLLRFMRSVGRAYRDEADPPPAVDPVTAQSALAPAPATSLTALAGEWSRRLRVAAVHVPRRSRLAASDPADAGFGFVIAATSRSAVAAARHNHNASFDAYAMAALHVAIAEWNAARGAACERVGVSQGVNLRPEAWWDDCVLNLAAFATVVTDPCDRADIAHALAVVAPQLEDGTRREHAREMVAAARAARAVPLAARAEVLAALPVDQFDTCAISNCGVLDDPPRLDDHARPVAWIITPAMPQSGPTIVVDAIGDSLHFSVCYRRELLTPADARAFVDGFVGALA
jgi:NRPS condensation-like uncharacterized protein